MQGIYYQPKRNLGDTLVFITDHGTNERLVKYHINVLKNYGMDCTLLYIQDKKTLTKKIKELGVIGGLITTIPHLIPYLISFYLAPVVYLTGYSADHYSRVGIFGIKNAIDQAAFILCQKKATKGFMERQLKRNVEYIEGRPWTSNILRLLQRFVGRYRIKRFYKSISRYMVNKKE